MLDACLFSYIHVQGSKPPRLTSLDLCYEPMAQRASDEPHDKVRILLSWCKEHDIVIHPDLEIVLNEPSTQTSVMKPSTATAIPLVDYSDDDSDDDGYDQDKTMHGKKNGTGHEERYAQAVEDNLIPGIAVIARNFVESGSTGMLWLGLNLGSFCLLSIALRGVLEHRAHCIPLILLRLSSYWQLTASYQKKQLNQIRMAFGLGPPFIDPNPTFRARSTARLEPRPGIAVPLRQ